ncbi:MAG: DUF6091 family protein [Burkholderiales bacterium]|nr:DUF6091 family protein [Burkholderiales bacterium]
MKPHSFSFLTNSAICLAAALACPVSAYAQAPAAAGKAVPIVCVFDILGTTGPVYSLAKDFQLEAVKQGYSFTIKAYTDERVAAEDFKVNNCQGLVATGLRTRQFNTFAGSIDSIGGVPSYEALGKLITTLADPKLAKYMVNGKYEIAAVFPVGAAYIFVNDRAINTLSKAAGKRIAALDYDKAQAELIQQVGAQPVASDISNFGQKFNNGTVDIIAAPAAAYRPLELFRGIGTKGGVARIPIAMVTYQIVMNRDYFPEDAGQKSRTFSLTQLDKALGIVKNMEKEIPANVWMEIPEKERQEYIVVMREARISMRDKGIYDKRMLSLMKRVRCQLTPADGECSLNLE